MECALKLSVLCVIAIWHISVRVDRVVLFLVNSKLKPEIKCFYSHSNCSVVLSSGHTSTCYPQQIKTFILLVDYDIIIFCLLSNNVSFGSFVSAYYYGVHGVIYIIM